MQKKVNSSIYKPNLFPYSRKGLGLSRSWEQPCPCLSYFHAHAFLQIQGLIFLLCQQTSPRACSVSCQVFLAMYFYPGWPLDFIKDADVRCLSFSSHKGFLWSFYFPYTCCFSVDGLHCNSLVSAFVKFPLLKKIMQISNFLTSAKKMLFLLL